MTPLFPRILACLAMALTAPGAAIAQATESGSDVVATVGDATITRSDLEKAVKAQLIELDNQRYEILEDGLGNLVSQKLLEMQAKTEGKTVEAYQNELMTAEVAEPGADEIQKVYEESKSQLGDRPLEEVQDRIVEFLKNQERAKKAQTLLAGLREKYPTSIKLAPPIIDVGDAGRASRGGDSSAPITIIAFSDYECPFCKRGEDVIDQVMAAYGDKVRYVHRDYPLPFHANARPAAETARCAGEQGKFWEVHDALFENSSSLSAEKIAELATAAGIDQAKLDDCLASGRAKQMVDEDMAAGGEVGVSGTPAFFVNGRLLSGAQPFDRFKSLIDAELARGGSN